MLVIACACRFANPDHYELNSGKLEGGQKPPCPERAGAEQPHAVSLG